ncbi:MAG: aminomethyl-transferring glycine dehydrogenase [Salinivirgaceae bacterium]|nr:aminomethyl-transferring glycine dehydrogenase [Salinivirgaceae bacterium]MDY0280270.1 aminomethyl-transferring glycine dehydrogenase [Salinivirgaceae bacterium]
METKNKFSARHIGPREQEIDIMLKSIGVKSLDMLIEQTVPASICLKEPMAMSQEGMTEYEYLNHIRRIAKKNKIFRSFIGQGYYETITPSVIIRNILENPGWYTSYTPYQAEISQGRLEALLNYQTVVSQLTGLPIANSSLLDEGSAAAEAMIMFFNKRDKAQVKNRVNKFVVDNDVFAQTKAVIETRAGVLGIEIVYCDILTHKFDDKTFGILVQYPTSQGEIIDYKEVTEKAHSAGAKVAVAADILSLTILTPPGQWGADVALGSTQRFGVPMSFGGPHAAYFAVTEEYKRQIPGRIIGISIDRHGNQALRMALQTREQHIKRERATSNICTAQALLATMAGMYVAYHGGAGVKQIACDIHCKTSELNSKIKSLGYNQLNTTFFDTLMIELPAQIKAETIRTLAEEQCINFFYSNNRVGISINETTSITDINDIIAIFAKAASKTAEKLSTIGCNPVFTPEMKRTDSYLQEEAFNRYHSETEMMRYIKKLERRDIALNHSMISLGSCTMKLNPATAMFPITWPEFTNMHPFAPVEQTTGYLEMIKETQDDLMVITGFDGFTVQPNSGATGEYSGLMVIRAYQKSINQEHRNIVLIPSSAHGTNPASAVVAGCDIVIVDCDEKGNIDVDDLKLKAEQYKDTLCAFMVTYPSTHGVFEGKIREMMDIIHNNGGQVYMDGANMNAQVGLTNPGFIGADVCHLNLHKTFAIPHGGGGPGIGPIGVAKHLIPFLPSNPYVKVGGDQAVKAISAAPYGSAGVLSITHAYIKMLGAKGLTQATKMAILNANYIAAKLNDYYNVLYVGEKGRCAHEMILDCRDFKQKYGVDATDIAKRLMDYGFHAPTLSFPVADTLMVEPTESESLQELDRFIEAMISIKKEIEAIGDEKTDNLLINAPHTVFEVTDNKWEHKYSRQEAAFPLEWLRANKFWPYVARVDNGFGDRNLVCTCAPISDYK